MWWQHAPRFLQPPVTLYSVPRRTRPKRWPDSMITTISAASSRKTRRSIRMGRLRAGGSGCAPRASRAPSLMSLRAERIEVESEVDLRREERGLGAVAGAVGVALVDRRALVLHAVVG